MAERRPGPATTDRLVRRGLKFSQLRLLAALRDTGQVSAAAQQTGMTQPAASRLLTALEEIVGAPLFTRHPRGVTLTEAGHLLADQAATMLHGLDLASARIDQVVEGARGLVRMGSVTGPSLEILLPVIREARLVYPEIRVSVQIDTSDKLADALLARELDFYIGRIPQGVDMRPFRLRVIGPEPIALMVRLDHPLTRRDPLTLEDCLAYDWVSQPPGGLLRGTMEAYLMARGLGLPRRVLSTSSTLFLLALVNETNAIAPIARSVADFFIERAALGSRLARLPVAGDMAVSDYGIVTRAEDPLSPAADQLLAMVAQRCG